MLIYLLLLGFVVGFKPIPFKKHSLSLSMTQDNENPKVEKNVTIRNIENYEIPSYSTKEFNFKKLVNVEHPKTKLSNKCFTFLTALCFSGASSIEI